MMMMMTAVRKTVKWTKINQVKCIWIFSHVIPWNHSSYLLLSSVAQKKTERKNLPSDVNEGRTIFIRCVILSNTQPCCLTLCVSLMSSKPSWLELIKCIFLCWVFWIHGAAKRTNITSSQEDAWICGVILVFFCYWQKQENTIVHRSWNITVVDIFHC